MLRTRLVDINTMMLSKVDFEHFWTRSKTQPNRGSIKSNRVYRSSIGTIGNSGETHCRLVATDDGDGK